MVAYRVIVWWHCTSTCVILEYRIGVIEPQASVEPQNYVEPQSFIEPHKVSGVGVNDIVPLVGWCGRPSRIPPGACNSVSLLYRIITGRGNALRVSC